MEMKVGQKAELIRPVQESRCISGGIYTSFKTLERERERWEMREMGLRTSQEEKGKSKSERRRARKTHLGTQWIDLVFGSSFLLIHTCFLHFHCVRKFLHCPWKPSSYTKILLFLFLFNNKTRNRTYQNNPCSYILVCKTHRRWYVTCFN